ncbi:hypothetical protein ACFLXB_08885 [Chloroflexota bacterium]
MSNKKDDILNLPPLLPDSGFGFDLAQMATTNSSGSMGDIHAINNKTLKQKIVIDSIASKTQYGMRRLLETDHYASMVFDETARSIMKINEDAQGSSYEGYYSAFNDRMIKTSARHILGLVEVAASSIAREVMRNPKPRPRIKQTFLQRLLT